MRFFLVTQQRQRRLIAELARVCRALIDNDPDAAQRTVEAMETYVRCGSCVSSADGDSWCGGRCSTCKLDTSAEAKARHR